MFKKLVIVLGVLVLASAQGCFIYAMQHGAADSFIRVWNTFDVIQTTYSQFVFGTIKWWWAVPVLCILLGGFFLWRPSLRLAVLALSISFIGTVALYWSAYAPTLLVNL